MSLVAEWRDPIRTGDGKPPLVIFFHGRGANEHDLLSCSGELPPEFAFAAPRGPVALDFGGSTWFENRGLGRPLGPSLRESVDLVQAWIDGLDATRFDPARIFLFGFSAGMLMASALLLGPARIAFAAPPSHPERNAPVGQWRDRADGGLFPRRFRSFTRAVTSTRSSRSIWSRAASRFSKTTAVRR